MLEAELKHIAKLQSAVTTIFEYPVNFVTPDGCFARWCFRKQVITLYNDELITLEATDISGVFFNPDLIEKLEALKEIAPNIEICELTSKMPPKRLWPMWTDAVDTISKYDGSYSLA